MNVDTNIVDNMCDLYIRVNASPNVGKFQLLKYLKEDGWHCELWTFLTPRVGHNYGKFSVWLSRNLGSPYHDLENPNGTWFHFVNNTGSCTDYIFAIRRREDHAAFLLEAKKIIKSLTEGKKYV